ncbi:SGNH/GDSL hydrolase family protein [Paenibacillus guangzhouensis]|uniref:SGNH/GDSL hydrolase family protein n=1 Tax=Paenibacillus guangzhouensis TaxID=1473112 RepID=UPI001266B530|nr:GDSL-type esterase/lipase family protein [Paenibacillus guangzhouensis]
MEPNVNPQWVKLVQSQHPEKMLSFVQQIDEGVLAALYGMDLATYRRVREALSQQVNVAAQQLLEDPAFVDRVDHLPFKQGETVVGLGESTTDDLVSWFEILRKLLELRRPQDAIRLINEGISGHTTAHVLGRMNGVMARQPDWILCMIGANDVMRISSAATKTLVSLEETARNIEEIRRIAAARSQSAWIWITPPTCDEERMAAYPYFQMGQLSWRNEDIIKVGERIRSMPELVIDIQASFGQSAMANFLGIDGLHPTIDGHKAIVRWVVEGLTGGNDR